MTYLNRYWLEKQKDTEPFIFLMYDTFASGRKARCELYHSFCIHMTLISTVCPHVSFANPQAPADADLRASVETRSIVVTEAE
jgi:hypothetical protein